MLVHVLLVAAAAWQPWPMKRRDSPTLGSLLETGRAALLEMGLDAKPPTPPFAQNLLDGFLALSQNATQTERRDWGKGLAAAFENFRVPAALVASSALFEAFSLPPMATDTLVIGVGKRAYLLCAITSFISSMITVSLSTSALVQLNQKERARDRCAREAGCVLEASPWPQLGCGVTRGSHCVRAGGLIVPCACTPGPLLRSLSLALS